MKAGAPTGHLKKALKRWVVRYRSFLQERFAKESKGGGTWPPLSPKTIASRRKGKGKRKVKAKGKSLSKGLKPQILRDTGLLFGALAPNFRSKPGGLAKFISNGVRVGYGGTQKHKKGIMKISDIAHTHQKGNPSKNLPKREIIVGPSKKVQNEMTKDLVLALKRENQ